MSNTSSTDALAKLNAAMAASNLAPRQTVQLTPVPAPEDTTVSAPTSIKNNTSEAPAAGEGSNLPALAQADLDNPDEANRFLSRFASGGGADTPAMGLSTLVDDVNDGGVKHELPFVSLKKGNWLAYAKNKDGVNEFMPAGQRPFRAVFLGMRLGLQAWPGEYVTGQSSAPSWSAAIPTQLAHKNSKELVAAAIRIANKIQYTKKHARTKFDSLGRVTPEVQFMLWTPDTGFFIAIVPSYNSTMATLHAWKTLEEKAGLPFTFEVQKEVEENAKAVNPNEKSWDVYFASGKIDVDARAVAMREAWEDQRNKHGAATAKTILRFHQAADYAGISTADLAPLLAKYSPLL